MCLPPRGRLDALKRSKNPWKIDEKGAPSPRAYLELVNRWTSQTAAWTRKLYERSYREWKRRKGRTDAEMSDDGDVLNEADAADLAGYLLEQLEAEQDNAPKPPTAQQIKTRGKPTARNSVRVALRDLREAGLPDRAALAMLPIPPKPGTPLSAIDLFEAGIAEDSLNAWALEGAAYIQKLDAENFARLAEKTVEVAARGMRWESMVSMLQSEYGTNAAHGRLIAQDQVAKLNAAITKDLNQKAGVETFIWRATMDTRTRQSHRDANGKEFPWSTGAPGVGFYGENGWPGQAGRCRCTARSVPPAWWREL